MKPVACTCRLGTCRLLLPPAPAAVKYQRTAVWWHRTTVKKLVFTFAVALLMLLILAVSAGPERVANKLLLYVRIARLYTKDPEQRIAMPLSEVSKQQIADTWHAPRGVDRLHEGQDIFAPRGTPVYSSTSGYVYNVGEDSLGGHTVSVIGAGGRVYYYAHLDSYAPNIEEGDYVTPRTILGYVGSTGNAAGTPPHLHFGVYTSSGAINPLPLLTDRIPEQAKNDQSTRPLKNQRKRQISTTRR